MFEVKRTRLNNLLEITFYALFFLTPLTFNFATKELFEFPKMILVYLFSTLALFLFLIKKRSSPRSSSVTLSLTLFVVSYFATTLLSTHRYTSLWGYYSRFNGGFFSLLAFYSIYLILNQFLNKIRTELIIRALFFSGLIISLYAVLQNFGFDKDFWVQDSQARAFSTLGQPNWLAAYLLVVLPIPIYHYLIAPNIKRRLFYFLSTGIFYFAFWSTYSLSGFLGLLAFVLLESLVNKDFLLAHLREILLLLFFCLSLSASRPGIFGAKIDSFIKTVGPKAYLIKDALAETLSPVTNKPIDTGDIRLSVWKGAASLFLSSTKNLIFGTGPETFAYNFIKFRPRELNRTSEWDFLYNKSHNYYLDLLTGSGLLGLLSYAYFVFVVTKKFIAEKNARNLLLFGGWLTIFVTNFFGWPTVSLSLLLYTLPVIIERLKTPVTEPELNNNQETVKLLTWKILPITILFIFVFTKILNVFVADISFASGLVEAESGRLDLSENRFLEATRLNSYEPAYHKELSYILAQEALLEDDNKKSLSFLSKALNEAQKSRDLNPKNSLTLRSLIRTYYLAAKLRPEYEKDLEDLSLKIIELSPTEPRSYYDAAVMYYFSENNDKALEYLRKALELKGDYLEAQELLGKLAEVKKLN